MVITQPGGDRSAPDGVRRRHPVDRSLPIGVQPGRVRRPDQRAPARRLVRQDPGADRRRAAERRLPARRRVRLLRHRCGRRQTGRGLLNGPQGSIWGSDAIGRGDRLHHPAGAERGARSISRAAPTEPRRSPARSDAPPTAGPWGFPPPAFRRTGFRRRIRATTTPPSLDPSLHATEPDGTRNLTASVRGRLTFSPAIEVDGQVRINQSRTDIDGFPPPFFEAIADTNDISTSRSASTPICTLAGSMGPLDLHNDFQRRPSYVDRPRRQRGVRGLRL